MKTYLLKVMSSLYIKHYKISATNLKEACKKAKIKFGKEFNYLGSDVKVSLEQKDLTNHIDEILEFIHG